VFVLCDEGEAYARKLSDAGGAVPRRRRVEGEGRHLSKAGDWQPYVLTDGLLITGQNQASSGPGAKVLLETLNKIAR
jgi:putative intracellular protease/amidase